MRRFLTPCLTGGLVIALATPATLFASGPADAGTPAGTPAGASVSAASASPILNSVERTVAAALRTAPAAPAAPVPMRRSRSANAAAQASSGGGSKTGMIIGLVTAAVGIAASVYMVKEMQKATDDITNLER